MPNEQLTIPRFAELILQIVQLDPVSVMKKPRVAFTSILFCITVIVLLLSVPGSLRQALARGEFYVFTEDFFKDLPKRLLGPGRFRFILQPLVATILGIRGGISDAQMSRPPYLFGLLFHRELRAEFLKSSFSAVVDLLLVGILLDSICQWLILGASYPGAALLVGPILIAVPYSLARALTNRCASLRREPMNSGDKSA